jgi:hypothetical protein
MEYEDFVCEIYKPLKAIEILSDIIYFKANEDWNLLGNNTPRNDFDELMALNYLINLAVKELLNMRKTCVNSF